MNDAKSLEELTAEISKLLIDSLDLLEIFDDIAEGERKMDYIVSNLEKNIKSAFENVERCRIMISLPN